MLIIANLPGDDKKKTQRGEKNHCLMPAGLGGSVVVIRKGERA